MPVSMFAHVLPRALCLALAAGTASITLAAAPEPTTLKKITALAIPFVPNAGQWNERAAFAAQTFAGTLFVTNQGELVYSLPGKPNLANVPVGEACRELGAHGPAGRGKPLLQVERVEPHCSARTPGWVLSETLVDTSGKLRSMATSTLKAPAGYRPMEGKVSYGIGNDPSKHADNLNTYERVNLGDMYPGINVQLRATGINVEKIFTVAPQQDPAQINVKLAGATQLELGDRGELIAHTGNGPVTFTAPIAFQEGADGARTAVAVAYALNATAERYGFALGSYDRSRALVIDPLLKSTYLGGTGSDAANALAIHPTTGEVYIAGTTNSTDLPSVTTATGGVATGAQSVKSTGNDAFVTRFNATLTSRLQSSYLGGTGTDEAYALAIHPTSGDVYITGFTDSTDLPGVAGGAQSVKSTDYDAFLTRFNAALTSRLQSSYLGGTGSDAAFALAIHPATGDVYIAGTTSSTDLPSVTIVSGGVATGAQSVKSTGNDAFVARFNAALTGRPQSTYLGGTGFEVANALAIHPATGEVLIAGYTDSSDLPSVTVASGGVATGAQSVKSTAEDAFVTRFDAALTSRLQSTYLGGTSDDYATALAVHPTTGEVYVAGQTRSTDLPSVTVASGGVATGAQSVKSIGYEAFVTRFNATLTSRPQSTYLGGSGTDGAFAMAIHPTTGEVFIAGVTVSADLPSVTVASGGVATGAQSVKSAGTDAFVTRFNAALTSRPQSTYLGGGLEDQGYAMAIHPSTGEVLIAGRTTSTDLPGAPSGAQSGNLGGEDAFVARFSADLSVAGACNLDIDRDNVLRASTDGLLILRRMLGLSGPALIANAVNPLGARTGDVAIANAIDALLAALDIDGSGGAPNGASDGLMLVRAMLGFTGTAVTNGAITGTPLRNTWPLIRSYLNDNCGTNFAP